MAGNFVFPEIDRSLLHRMQLYLYAKRYACFLTLLGFIKIFLKIANDRFLVQQERGLQCTHAYELFLEYNFDLGLNKFQCWDGYQRQCQKMYLSFLRGPRLFSDRCSRRLVAIVWIHRATENFDKTLCSGISPVQARCIDKLRCVTNGKKKTGSVRATISADHRVSKLSSSRKMAVAVWS